MRDYDDDNTGVIDYRKFCENVLMSHPDGAWRALASLGGDTETGPTKPEPNRSRPNTKGEGKTATQHSCPAVSEEREGRGTLHT